MTRSCRSELFNYGKRVMTFIRSALIGARARAWLGLKRLEQMHPKTFTTGNSLLSHLVPLLRRNVRRIRLTCMHERERGRERQRGKEKIVLLFPLRGSVLRALFYGVVSLGGIVSPSSHTYAHTYRRCRYTNVRNAQIDTRGGTDYSVGRTGEWTATAAAGEVE